MRTKAELVCWLVGVGLLQTALVATSLLLKLAARSNLTMPRFRPT